MPFLNGPGTLATRSESCGWPPGSAGAQGSTGEGFVPLGVLQPTRTETGVTGVRCCLVSARMILGGGGVRSRLADRPRLLDPKEGLGGGGVRSRLAHLPMLLEGVGHLLGD